MSEVKLNLVDNQHILAGTIHGSVADRCIAALSAEPESTAELAAALARYMRPLDAIGPFASFHTGSEIDREPWDAGLVVIDLAARVVAAESTYCQPSPEGEVDYHDGTKATDISIPYRLPADWLFVNSIEAYLWSRERRYEARKACPPLDARATLYGLPLLEFIAGSIGSSDARAILSSNDEEARAQLITSIHRRWLMTPRDELNGRSPRDVLLEKQDLIDFDLQTRCLQWTFVGEGPPCLSPDSYAYRFAGFGTHEWVVYYDLVRHLLDEAAQLLMSFMRSFRVSAFGVRRPVGALAPTPNPRLLPQMRLAAP